MNYSFHPTLFLRSPSYSIENLNTENLSIESIKEKVKNDDFFQKALYLASSDFYNHINFRLDKISTDFHDNDKKQKKSLISLYKYYSRCCSKSTPFGLFSSISCAKWANETEVRLTDKLLLNSKADYNIAFGIFKNIQQNHSLRKQTIVYPNMSIYQVGNELRFIDCTYKSELKKFSISSVISNNALLEILELAKNGISFSVLLDFLISKGYNEQDSENYLNSLLNMNVLLSEFELNITGKHPLERLICRLSSVSENNTKKQVNKIASFREKIKSINSSDDDLIDKIKKIENYLESNNLDYKNAIQIDSYKELIQNTISKGLQRKIVDGLMFINAFGNKPKSTNLSKFKERFFERFGSQAVNLLLALDPENGIGYPIDKLSTPTSFVQNISFNTRNHSTTIKRNRNQKYLQRRLNESIRNGDYNLNLEKNLLEQLNLTKEFNNFPDTLTVIFNLLDRRNVLIQSAGGSSAASYLGRFAHLDDKIEDFVNDIYYEEERLNSDSVVAEIIHSPNVKMGNILYRKNVRKYEIPIISSSSVESDYKILLSDLYLKMIKNEIVLFSRKLGKKVVPKLSNAHSFGDSDIPIYSFLCDIQHQNNDQILNFSWGDDSLSYPFLPRLTYEKNVILAPATWNLYSAEIRELSNLKELELVAEIEKWRNKHNIPVNVNLIDNGNELYINLQSELSIRALISIVKTFNIFTLKEFLFDKFDGVVKSIKSKKYANEFIATLVKKEESVTTKKLYFEQVENEVHRVFEIPSNWMYYKIYCGERAAQKIISDLILPEMQKLKDSELIHTWYFIRYRDTDYHLRLRLELISEKDFSVVNRKLKKVFSKAFYEKTIWKIQMETYKREIEEYGNYFIINAEKIFHNDSTLVASFIKYYQSNELLMIYFSMISIDRFLNDFLFDIAAKNEILKEKINESFQRFDPEKSQRRKIYNKYKLVEENLEKLLVKKDYSSVFNEHDITFILNQRSQANNNHLVHLNKMDDESKSSVISNLIHMCCNRIFPVEVYKYELTTFVFLQKFYLTEINKRRNE